MKKNSKLLAFIIVFAMILSSMVVPVTVSAAAANLIPDPGFANGELIKNWTDNSNGNPTVIATDSSDGDGKSVYVTAGQTGSLNYNFTAKPNAYYFMSGKIKMTEKSNTRASLRTNGDYSSNTVESFKTQMNVDPEWLPVYGLYHANDISEATGRAMYVYFNNTNYSSHYYADDFGLYELSINETENVPVEGILTLNAPETIALVSSDIAFTNGGVVTGVEFDETNDVWEISYTGMTAGSENSITFTLNNLLKSAFSPKDLTVIPTFAFTVKELSSAPVSDDIIAGKSLTGDGVTIAAHATEEGAYTATKTTGHKVRALDVVFQTGKKYVSTAYIKNAATSDKLNGQSWINVEVSGASAHKLTATAVSDRQNLGSDWTKVIGFITTAEAQCDGSCGGTCTKNATKAHLDLRTTSTAGNFDFKNFQLRELKQIGSSSYLGAIVSEGDDATLYLTGAEGDVYFAAASFEGAKVTDIQLKKASVTENALTTIEIKAGDNYKVFIWDTDLNPLLKAFMGSDF